MKLMKLDISDELRQMVLDGASHVAVSIREFEHEAVGVVMDAGTEDECRLACAPKIIIRFDWDTSDYRQEVWLADEIRALLMEAPCKSNQHGKNSRPLNEVAYLAGWQTPKATDGSKAPKYDFQKNLTLVGQALASGTTSTCAPASTEKRGALNPEHSRWLMGFPSEWASCERTATQ